MEERVRERRPRSSQQSPSTGPGQEEEVVSVSSSDGSWEEVRFFAPLGAVMK